MPEIESKESPRTIELLAPARDLTVGIAAIDHGADAVYIGAPSHGARSNATNSIADIEALTTYAHRFGARVYVTVNTIIYDDELENVRRMVCDLYRIGVDALIVQDMALLKMDLPPIALHASTQCDIRTPQKAVFLQNAGFEQLVLARELTAKEIKAISEKVEVPLEVFVHGALCVSFSGDCQASYLSTGRSANRGECAQICRYRFSLEDGSGNVLVRDRHLLSLKDMNRLDRLEDLLEAGASSFKIEGRLKSIDYVKNVVAAYSDALNRIIASDPGKYRRRSMGTVHRNFAPDLKRSFNRGYTDYFLRDRDKPGQLANFLTPKWVGQEVGQVRKVKTARIFEIDPRMPLNNGDGLGYFNEQGELVGFRLNRRDGNLCYAASDVKLTPGMTLYRNADKGWADLMAGKTAERRIGVKMELTNRAMEGNADGELTLKVFCNESLEYQGIASVKTCLDKAQKPQEDVRKRTLSKLGDTVYELVDVEDAVGNMFVPASMLTELRRQAVAELDKAIMTSERGRQAASAEKHNPQLTWELTRHDNVANRLSAEFYREAKADNIPMAAEAGGASGEAEPRVMQTRYCLRRELGACLKTAEARSLPRDLILVSGNLRLRVECDCANCRMNLYKIR